jgi:hypothetical protein
MERAIEHAGFLAAHAVWCVSSGEVLIPMFASEGPGERRQMLRAVTERAEDGVAQAREWLASNVHAAENSVVVFDGYITLPTGKTDALFIEIRDYVADTTLVMAVPYRNAADPAGFAVYRPKFLEAGGAWTPDYAGLGQGFFRGVDRHERGAEVWNSHLDQSL